MKHALLLGSRGSDVKAIKKLLNDRLHLQPALAVNEVFDKETDKAVKLFQIDNFLGINGEVDIETYAALQNKKNTLPNKQAVLAIKSANWMKIAEKEIGQSELPGNTHNPRIIAYHATTTLRATNDETPWCSSFVNWVLSQAGIKGTNSAAAISWMNWGRAMASQSGAIVVIHNNKLQTSSLSYSGYHVAFLIKETATHYHLLGGNQRNRVKVSRYPKKSWALTASRWPN